MMKEIVMKALDELKKHLVPGKLYRREQIAKWSNAVDRHLKQLQQEDYLKKLSGGLYYCPKTSAFGETPPDDRDLVESFLKDDRFLMFSSNSYNNLGLGTSQLYNETIVYNHKRHGLFKLGNRTFRFVMKHSFPTKLSGSFLLVDLMDHPDRLLEDKAKVSELLKNKLATMNIETISNMVKKYGGVKSRKILSQKTKGWLR